MSKKYPKNIFVQFQGDEGNEFLQAEVKIEKVPDDGKVAIYELKEVKTRKTDVKVS